MKVEERIKELGLSLPVSSPPGALYVPVKAIGNVLFVSGQVPIKDGKPIYTGKVGKERSIEYAQEAARMCIMNLLAAVKDKYNDLDVIKDIVKIQAFVNSETGFDQQHIVVNAASQLLYEILGEAGRHARTAVGTNQLPMDVTVEIEAIIELKKDDYEV